MSTFIVIALLGLAATLLVLLRPLLWRARSASSAASHRQLNAAIYRDQFAELERDRAEGTLSEDDYLQARSELQRRVLEDGAEEAPGTATAPAPKKTLLALALLVPVASLALYLVLGNPQGLAPAEHQRRFTAADIERMVAGLAARLEGEPDNAEGWAMLARSYKALRRYDDAEQAFARAAKLSAGDAQLLAEYADVLAMKAGGKLAGRPAEVVDQALKADANNLQALWLAGTAAFEVGRYENAVALWERLLKLLPPESEEAKQIAAGIAEARAGAKSGRAAAPAATK